MTIAWGRTFTAVFALGSLFALSCGSDEEKETADTCQVGTDQGCDEGLVCEDVADGNPACFEPVKVEGTVTGALDGAPVEGAIVVARDANGAAVSGTATTDADGHYSLVVPVPRNAEGEPMETEYTLRADASGYETFPMAPRVAIPVRVDAETKGVVEGAATDIVLLPLEDSQDLGTISGKVDVEEPKGTLVVAGESTALVDTDGSFTLFNVPEGEVTVTAYQQGSNLEPVSVDVIAGETVAVLSIQATDAAAHQVSGKVEIVNPGDGTDTSVILVVEDTFVENAARGEVPPGLRATGVSGDFSIEGVPDGRYVVLAAFENDDLVRDPDVCIGGTEIVRIQVEGDDIVLDDSFKVTGSLEVIDPDGEELVSGVPTLRWADDSGEDHYEVAIYDAKGNQVWQKLDVPGVSGEKEVSVECTDAELESGMVYQFRATSIKKDACPISRTEDLRGVFRVE